MWTRKITVGQWMGGSGFIEMYFSSSEDGVFFCVYTHTHTHTHTHKRTHTHRTFSQNPAKFFPFSVEKNQLRLVVSFQKPLLMV